MQTLKEFIADGSGMILLTQDVKNFENEMKEKYNINIAIFTYDRDSAREDMLTIDSLMGRLNRMKLVLEDLGI
ncbi:MAG: hypothetical protein V3V00_15705 [Saprospiraceae bacterium]